MVWSRETKTDRQTKKNKSSKCRNEINVALAFCKITAQTNHIKLITGLHRFFSFISQPSNSAVVSSVSTGLIQVSDAVFTTHNGLHTDWMCNTFLRQTLRRIVIQKHREINNPSLLRFVTTSWQFVSGANVVYQQTKFDKSIKTDSFSSSGNMDDDFF